MPESDELGREYTDREARLWREAQFAVKARGGAVRLSQTEEGAGMDLNKLAQIGRTWSNDNLARVSDGGRTVVSLTPFGRQFTFEDTFGDIEER